jgi:hypothetical protein
MVAAFPELHHSLLCQHQQLCFAMASIPLIAQHGTTIRVHISGVACRTMDVGCSWLLVSMLCVWCNAARDAVRCVGVCVHA